MRAENMVTDDLDLRRFNSESNDDTQLKSQRVMLSHKAIGDVRNSMPLQGNAAENFTDDDNDSIERSPAITLGSGGLFRKHEDILPDSLAFVASTSSSSPLRFESFAGDPGDNFKIFTFLKKSKALLEEITGGRATFRISPTASKQSVVFEPPSDMAKKRLRLDDPENKAIAQQIHDWISLSLKSLEPKLSQLLNEEYDVSVIEAELKEQNQLTDLPVS